MATEAQSSPIRKRPVKTALHQAVLDGRLHQVRLLVSKHSSNVDCRDINGRTPLMLACMLDSEEYGWKMAKIFIQAGTYLNIRDNMGRTALSYACMNGREEIGGLILREDVLDLNDSDNDGYTPLHHATTSGNPRVVEVLADLIVKFGLNIDCRNSLGYTPLLMACKMGHYVSAYLLFTKGQASSALRDNEFFLTASEWIRRGFETGCNSAANVVERKIATAPVFFSISREKTMYHRAFTPICRHTRSQPNSLTSSCGSFLKFPLIFHSPRGNHTDGGETFIQGKEARQLLLSTIEELPTKRPFSTRTQYSRIAPPSSAKLRALTQRSHTMMVPDMKTIFNIYSDQYGYTMQLKALADENVRRPSRAISFSSSARTSSRGESNDIPPIASN